MKLLHRWLLRLELLVGGELAGHWLVYRCDPEAMANRLLWLVVSRPGYKWLLGWWQWSFITLLVVTITTLLDDQSGALWLWWRITLSNVLLYMADLFTYARVSPRQTRYWTFSWASAAIGAHLYPLSNLPLLRLHVLFYCWHQSVTPLGRLMFVDSFRGDLDRCRVAYLCQELLWLRLDHFRFLLTWLLLLWDRASPCNELTLEILKFARLLVYHIHELHFSYRSPLFLLHLLLRLHHLLLLLVTV